MPGVYLIRLGWLPLVVRGAPLGPRLHPRPRLEGDILDRVGRCVVPARYV